MLGLKCPKKLVELREKRREIDHEIAVFIEGLMLKVKQKNNTNLMRAHGCMGYYN